MRSIKKLKNLKGKMVLVRVDFNVPVKNGKILDDFRIRASLPTINYLRKKEAKVILLAHLGRRGETLKPVAKYLNKFFPVTFGKKIAMKQSGVVLLENLRKNPGEEKNSLSFAKELASLGDIYVNDAFAVSHRKQASIYELPKLLPSYTGFQLEKEIKNLSSAFKPKKPFLLILGGAKFETKMPLLKKFLKKADFIFVAGALANNFFKELGFEIGYSVADRKNFGLKKLIDTGKIFLPVDLILKKGRNTDHRKINEVKKDEMIVDIGPQSINLLKALVKKVKFILWNGPLEYSEIGFDKSTKEILKTILKSRKKAIIGGGDTIAVAQNYKLQITNHKNIFVSTGGGAMLEFLEKGTLPGIEALEAKNTVNTVN